MKVDLHCHTLISDGSFSFHDVITLAKQEEITHLAITNHDTTQSLTEMVIEGKTQGIEIIPGIEISAYDHQRERRVHILGYYLIPEHPSILQLCSPLLEQRHEASKIMVERLILAGYQITWEQVEKYAKDGTGVYKQHIMQALMDQNYTTSIYGDLYRTCFAKQSPEGKPGIAYVPLEYPSAVEAVQAIIQANGVAVLAHPGQYKNFDILPELVDAGLKGIEVYHPSHQDSDLAKAMQYAKEYSLIATGGSDFHGLYDEKPVRLGSFDPGIASVHALKAIRDLIN